MVGKQPVWRWVWSACVAAGLSLVTGLSAATAQGALDARDVLDPVFTDHAVVQRGGPIRVWGQALPGEAVDVRLGTRRVRAVAASDGRWQAALPAMRAGGPYQLTARTASGLEDSASDVMVGDVYLCSGQSNMEWTVRMNDRGVSGPAWAANPRIRLLTVPRASVAAPLTSLPDFASWKVAGPEATPDFSATCFYFAHALQAHQSVPIGLISAAWGGSQLQVWLSDEAIATLPNTATGRALLTLYRTDRTAAYRGFGTIWQAWWGGSADTAPWTAAGKAIGSWQPVPEPLRDWKTWGRADTERFDGLIWFRKTVRLDASAAARLNQIALGGMDEIDHVWINGQMIGQSFGWGDRRTYGVPEGLLKPGDNEIVIGLVSYWDQAGLLGPADVMALTGPEGARVAINDGWTWQKADRPLWDMPRAPWDSLNGQSVLGNGMIAPLRNYGFKGVLWYQGESNAGFPDGYDRLLAALMADWRRQFEANLPFLIVQLPELGAPSSNVQEASGWAGLRERQRLAVKADRNAALAVTYGTGNRDDVHPRNKREVGRRLSDAARALIYGERISGTAPRPQALVRSGQTIKVRWRDVVGALRAGEGGAVGNLEVCGPGPGTCRPVTARLTGPRELVLDVGSGPVSRVRYCWGDAPVCQLVDGRGWQAGPFEEPVR